MITDGFSNGNSLSEIAGNELKNTLSLGGVSSKVYVQECRGLAENGQHGWYHIGVDIVDDLTGKVIDSIPVSTDSDEEHYGHYRLEQIDAVIVKLQDAYKQAYDVSVAGDEAQGKTFSHDDWVETFAELKMMRDAERRFSNMLMALLSPDGGDMMSGLADSDDGLGKMIADLLGDFDPDAVEPTDEGLPDEDLDVSDTSK